MLKKNRIRKLCTIADFCHASCHRPYRKRGWGLEKKTSEKWNLRNILNYRVFAREFIYVTFSQNRNLFIFIPLAFLLKVSACAHVNFKISIQSPKAHLIFKRHGYEVRVKELPEQCSTIIFHGANPSNQELKVCCPRRRHWMSDVASDGWKNKCKKSLLYHKKKRDTRGKLANHEESWQEELKLWNT